MSAPDSAVPSWADLASARRALEAKELDALRGALATLGLQVVDAEPRGGGRWAVVLEPALDAPGRALAMPSVAVRQTPVPDMGIAPLAVSSPMPSLPSVPTPPSRSPEPAPAPVRDDAPERPDTSALRSPAAGAPPVVPPLVPPVIPPVMPPVTPAADRPAPPPLASLPPVPPVAARPSSPTAVPATTAPLPPLAPLAPLPPSGSPIQQQPMPASGRTVPDDLIRIEGLAPVVVPSAPAATAVTAPTIAPAAPAAARPAGPAALDALFAADASTPRVPDSGSPRPNPFKEPSRDPIAIARRYARTLAGDVVAYRASAHAEALAAGLDAVRTQFAADIEKARTDFYAQIKAADVPDHAAIFMEAVNEIIGNHQPLLA